MSPIATTGIVLGGVFAVVLWFLVRPMLFGPAP
jgi:hypothetical protein